MAMFSLTTRSNSPRRTADGQKWSEFPVLTGATEHVLAMPGCAHCTKSSDHGPPCSRIGVKPRYGHTRAYGQDTDEYCSADNFARVFSALWILEYCMYGMIGDSTIYNAGSGADNASQSFTYEVISVSGVTATLKGRNPKRYQETRSSFDPLWPDVGHESRLIDTGVNFALREGARVEFLYPSVLEGRLTPYIKKINPPASDAADGVTFTVELSHSVDHARDPRDLAFPPADGKYYCKVRWYEFYPEEWPVVQNTVETQFSSKVQSFTRADAVSSSGLLSLSGVDEADCRVIYPGMTPLALNAMAVLILRDTGPQALTEAEMLAILSTDQSGASWITTLDVSAYLAADTDSHIIAFSIAFRPEATSGSDPVLIQFTATCANDQATKSESYGGARRCMAAATASKADDYNPGGCWQPECSKFCLGTGRTGETYRSENIVRTQSDLRNSNLFTRAWVACSWLLNQGMPGISTSRNFHLSRPAGALGSLGQLLGSGCGDQVPLGMFATQVPWHQAIAGARVTGTDGSGATQTIVKGAFTAQDTWTAGTTPTTGYLSGIVSGWTTQTDALGNAMPSPLAMFPHGRPGHCHLYSFDTSGNGYHLTNRLCANSEAFATSVLPGDAEDDELAAELRARFA